MLDFALQYRTFCSQLNECDSEEKVRIHNRAMKKLETLYHKVEKEPDKSFMLPLLRDSNPNVRITSAMHCLKLGIYSIEAHNALLELSKDNNAQVAFTANACLYTLERRKRDSF